ncbi:MAG: aminopeptidase P family protein [Sedimentisphaerales bacterium]|nr:aminopeptidase P family protein [Sedimentisphaerales bacterium]
MKRAWIQQRVANTREQLRSRHIDALILTRPANVSYLTGFAGEDSWAIVAAKATYLLTDSRYTEQAHKECVGTTIVERTDLIAPACGKLVRKLRSAKVAVESSIPVAMYQTLRKSAGLPVKAVGNIIETLRAVKDEEETAAIRAAAAIAAGAFKRAIRHARPGVTEGELAGVLDLEMRRHGAKVGFDTIVAFGPNASRPHHQPGARKLAATDTVLIDFGARYKGYCCDITRSFAIGKATAAWRKAYQVVEKAQAAAIEAAKAGMELAKLDAIPRTVIRESHLPVYGHGTGHGFGLEIHEIPFLREKVEGSLKAGQIITIEPGIYLPGKLGVRIEDDIRITESGCEVLTTECPRTPPPA